MTDCLFRQDSASGAAHVVFVNKRQIPDNQRSCSRVCARRPERCLGKLLCVPLLLAIPTLFFAMGILIRLSLGSTCAPYPTHARSWLATEGPLGHNDVVNRYRVLLARSYSSKAQAEANVPERLFYVVSLPSLT